MVGAEGTDNAASRHPNPQYCPYRPFTDSSSFGAS